MKMSFAELERSPDPPEVVPRRKSVRSDAVGTARPPNVSVGQRGRNAAIGFLVGFYQTKVDAGAANGVRYQNVQYWIKQYRHLSDALLVDVAENADLPSLLAAVPSSSIAQAKALERGDEGYTEAFSKAYKWAGLQKNGVSVKGGGGVSNYRIALDAKEKFGLAAFHPSNVARASKAPNSVMSSARRKSTWEMRRRGRSWEKMAKLRAGSSSLVVLLTGRSSSRSGLLRLRRSSRRRVWRRGSAWTERQRRQRRRRRSAVRVGSCTIRGYRRSRAMLQARC